MRIIKKAALRSSTFLSLFILAGTTTGLAQDLPADDASEAEAIVVTGSRIARPDLDASVPVAIVSRETIQQTGAVNIQDVLNELPAVGTNISRSSSNFQNTGNGSATVNLRNLGEERTLVLVNGRRFVAGIPGTSIVDLNSIPTDLIKQIDVVTGGASAVYGSEAIAGVVNFILDDKFEGLRVRGQANVTSRGDAPRQLVSITGGKSFADGRGHVVLNGQYDRDEGLRSRKRGYSAVDTPNRSSYAAQGLFSPTNDFSPGNAFTFDANNALKLYESANIDGYNRQNDRYLSVPVERYLATGLASFEFSPAATFYVEGTYAKTKTKAGLEPQAVDGTPDGTDLDLGGIPYQGIPIDNPFIPATIRQAMIDAGVTALPFRRRSNDIFDRSNRTDRETWRIVAGLRGDLGTGLNLKYDVYYNHGETKDYTRAETIFAPEYVNALDAVAGPNGPVCRINVDANPNNNDAACVPLNIFGFNTVDPRAASYLTRNNSLYTYRARVKQDVFSGTLTGNFGSLWGGPINFAIGAEHRRESSSEDFDEATNNGTALGNQISDVFGKYKVTEVFGEVVVPIVEDRPFLHYFGIEGAARYADYSTVGGVWSWKVGATWAPIPDIRLRGVYSQATRAPNISELYSAPSETFPATIDPCDQRGGEGDGAPIIIPAASLPAACLANPAIAAAAATPGGFVYSTAQIQTINGFLGGNPTLTEETGKTLTLGAVFTPRFARNLSLTVDYYKIKVTNAVGIIGQQTSLDECVTGSGAALFCDNVTRNAAGRVTRIDALNLNVGSYKVEGIDIGARFRHEFSEQARVDLSVNWTHLLAQEQTSFQGGPIQDELGQLDCYECGRLGTGFKDKANGSLKFTYGPYSLSWTTTYLGPVRDTLGPGSIRVGSFFYHDAQLRAALDDDRRFEFYFGVDNMFDKRPPLFGDTNIVTYPGTRTSATTYDTFGRMLYAGVDVKF